MLTTLARHLGVGRSAMSIANIAKLVRGGYVRRERAEQDRRAVHLTLTTAGVRFTEQNKVLDKDLVRELFRADAPERTGRGAEWLGAHVAACQCSCGATGQGTRAMKVAVIVIGGPPIVALADLCRGCLAAAVAPGVAQCPVSSTTRAAVCAHRGSTRLAARCYLVRDLDRRHRPTLDARDHSRRQHHRL